MSELLDDDQNGNESEAAFRQELGKSQFVLRVSGVLLSIVGVGGVLLVFSTMRGGFWLNNWHSIVITTGFMTMFALMPLLAFHQNQYKKWQQSIQQVFNYNDWEGLSAHGKTVWKLWGIFLIATTITIGLPISNTLYEDVYYRYIYQEHILDEPTEEWMEVEEVPEGIPTEAPVEDATDFSPPNNSLDDE